MKIVRVNFNSEHKAMLGHCKMILENDGGHIEINPVPAEEGNSRLYVQLLLINKIQTENI
jgi:hypothetical protein